MAKGIHGQLRLGALIAPAAAALLLALLMGAPSSAVAATEVKTFPAQVAYEHGNRAEDPGNCSAATFVVWQEPVATVKAMPIAWTVYYQYSGKEKSKPAKPPFDDVFKWVIEYRVSPGSHWVNVGLGWSDGPKVNDCTEMSEKHKGVIGPVARVEITYELQAPKIDPAKCKAARSALKARNKSVSKLLGQLRKASTQKAKSRIRGQLAKARTNRAKAVQRVAKDCTT